MSEAALERVVAASEALVQALDAHDADMLHASHERLREALADLAAAGGWRVRADLRQRVIHAQRTLDAARGRVNYLADDNRARLDRLSALTGTPRTSPYGRSGRLG